MKQKPVKNLEKYTEKWVAIDERRGVVVASDKSLKKVYRKASSKKVVFMSVPPLTPYSP